MDNQYQDNTTAFDEWKELHRRQLPYILAAVGSVILIGVIIHLASLGSEPFQLYADEIVLFFDLLILPLAAINAVFFTKRLLQNRLAARKMIAVKLLSVALSVMLMSWILESIYSTFGYVDNDYLFLGNYRMSASMTNVVEYTVYSLIIAAPIFIWNLRITELSQKLKEREVEQERLMRLKTQAELHALQSRINPHFLFNAFNSVASLISSDPVGAEKMMVQLSELFRYSLNSQASNFIPLSEEIRIVEIYLNIEKVRFGENLNYEICIPEEMNDALITRFLIQPLVENAVKHSISKMKNGQIKLVLNEAEGKITIAVFDNGPAFANDIKLGFGLQSTYDKLQLLYPGDHEVAFINSPEKHLKISFGSKNHQR